MNMFKKTLVCLTAAAMMGAQGVTAVMAEGDTAETGEASSFTLSTVTTGGASAYVLDYTGESDIYTENPSFSAPFYFVYPDGAVDEEGAEALIADLGIADYAEESASKVVIMNPVEEAYGEADAAAFLTALDELTGLSLNVKVIGVGAGATFVNQQIAQEDWAVAGIMTYGGEAGEPAKYTVPVYVSNSAEDVAAAYIEADNAVETKAGDVTVYTDPDNHFNVVAVAGEETLAEAFANAWDYVLSNNGRIGNIIADGGTYGTWYMQALSTEREFAYYTYLDSEKLGLVRNVETGDVDGDGEDSLWYEYLPESTLDAEDGTVPLVVLMHGNTNDPRSQAATSGWSKVAAEEGIILVEPEWQTNNNGYDPLITDDSVGIDASDLEAFVEMICEKYPQIDTTRIYMEGLSRGARNSLNYGISNPSLFAAVGAHSGGIATASIDFDTLTASLKTNEDEYQMPIYMVAGVVDEVVHFNQGYENSDLMLGLQYYEEMNGLEVTDKASLVKTEDNVFGVDFDYEGYVDLEGEVPMYNGTLVADDGTEISMNAITDWGHWNYEATAADMWKFFQKYSRVDGVLYVNGNATEQDIDVYAEVEDNGELISRMTVTYDGEVDPASVTNDTYTVTVTTSVDETKTGECWFENPGTTELKVVKTEVSGNTVTVYFNEEVGTVGYLKLARNTPLTISIEAEQEAITLTDGTTVQPKLNCDVESYADLINEETEKFESVTDEPVAYEIHEGTNDALIVWFHGNGEGDYTTLDTGEQTYNNVAQMLANRGTVAWASDEAQEVFGDATVVAFQAPSMWYYATADDNALLKQVKAEIDEIVAEYGIDEDQIYVSGCSAGGFMTTRMVIAYPDLFKAAMINCPALNVADSRSGLTGATPTDEELRTLKDSDTAIWLVQGETDGTVTTEECSERIWKILTEDTAAEDITTTTFEGTAGIASGFTTRETADGKYKISLYETTDEAKLKFAEDFDQDGVLTETLYSNHWSWIYTLRNNPEAADGTHIWQWAANYEKAQTAADITVIVNGKVIDAKYYTVDANGTVTLTEEFKATLAAGKYTMTITVDGKTTETTFTIAESDKKSDTKKDSGVNTGDTFHAGILGGVIAACAALAAAAFFALKKRK